MKKTIDVFNGEKTPITVVTDYETTVIQPEESKLVKVGKNAVFGTDEFYVEEDGQWYAKEEHCFTGCDVEIYRED